MLFSFCADRCDKLSYKSVDPKIASGFTADSLGQASLLPGKDSIALIAPKTYDFDIFTGYSNKITLLL